MKTEKDWIAGLIKSLESFKKGPIKGKIFIGCDGYVDQIRRAVKTRTTSGTVEYFETITGFSDRLAAAAGKSGQVELITDNVKLGGNAPIMANALGHLGVENYCLGNSGFPSLHPSYKEMHPKVNLLPVGNPGESIALEFNDGKIILSELTVFRDLNWDQVKKTADIKKINKGMNDCEILALVGWCNPDHATDVWKGILKEVMPQSPAKKLIFFDLADPSKKSKEDLLEVLSVMNSFQKFGKAILGLNENETLKLYHIISDTLPGEDHSDLKTKSKAIFDFMKIEGLLVHPVDRSIYVDRSGIREISGRVVKDPIISTGGGDNLNAGFCLGYLLGASVEESMILGMATSGSYVKNGKSPDIKAIIEYLNSW